LDQSELSGVAINGDLETDGGGFGVGFYYQLAPIGDAFVTLAARYQERVIEDDEAIVSGASLLQFEQERTSFELSILGENKNWSQGAWRPYTAFGIRSTEAVENIDTSGGAPISDSDSTDVFAQFSAGIQYQWNRLSWFLEGTASTDSDDTLKLHTGVRLSLYPASAERE